MEGLIIIAALIAIIIAFVWIDTDQANRYYKKIKGGK